MLKLLLASLLTSRASAVLLPMELGRLEVRDDTYNCHANCGYAILEIDATTDLCTDEIFLEDYANCLQCAGSDNDNIWQYYGDSLASAAASCGLATTPESGSQADVGTAIEAGATGSSNATAATTTSATEASTSTSASAAASVGSTANSTTTSATATAASSAASSSASAEATSVSSSSSSAAAAPARTMAAGLVGIAAFGAAYAAVY